MKHMTLTAITAALLVSTSAFAMDMKASSEASIDSLPDKGAVSLSGTVDKVIDGDTFILRDSEGETIDVHTASNVNVNKGDVISVKGDKTAEVAGIGEEINNASITLSGEVKKMASTAKDTVKNTTAATTGAVAGAVGALTSANIDANTKARVEMKNEENMESPGKASDNTETKKTAAYDIDVDVDADTDKVASAGEMTAGEATRLSNDKAEKAADRATSTVANVQGTIDALPKEGIAELNGVVAEVDNDQSFTLRDSEGKTIEVNTASNVEVQPGDTVSVNGNVKSKLLGLGREIESAKVLVVSAAR